ncbi:hypothetical protein [Asticcacaulis taihuensis]|uniref:hypothetical protein n=1 Tax=Asticcacaulis taihuensis TaxID=260084 RepID=UPI0026EAFE62|nr:hypothetical protein [Asticcacaulis taihuensis]
MTARLNDRSRKPNSNAPFGVRECQWCGEEFAKRGGSQLFCSDPHKTAFNNLRKERGAQLYDLFVALRYERKLAAGLKVWSLICTMIAHFREEDRQKRSGRRSWMPARTVTERRPYLFNPLRQARKGKKS